MTQLIDLYSLLPAVYKQQDLASQNDPSLSPPLQAMFSILQQEFENIQGQIDTAYNNCFIETCESWAEAYIATLLGIQDLDGDNILATQRARIANTIRYRRHKGQQGVLERIISDVTGWSTSILEYMPLLGATQYLQHIRDHQSKTMDIRNVYGVSTLSTPFEINAHRVDVRSYPTYPAKFNINQVGLFIWRLASYPVIDAQAYAMPGMNNGYTFNPIGLDTQLFNASQPPTDLTQIATESSLPVAIRPSAFAQDLSTNANQNNCVYYGHSSKVNQISITVVMNGQNYPLMANQIVAADLSNWQTNQPILSEKQAAIDVQLGRFLLGSGYTDADQVNVNYNYGFSAPAPIDGESGGGMGAGHYDRGQTLETVSSENTIFVPTAPPNISNPIIKTTLSEAVNYWQNNPSLSIIQIQDDGTYLMDENLILSNASENNTRSCTIQAANNTRPCLQMQVNTSIQLESNSNEETPLIVKLNGLLINGTINTTQQNSQSTLIELGENVVLTVEHCTLVPQFIEPTPENHLIQRKNVISLHSQNNNTQLQISHSITGALCLPEQMNVSINDSVIDDQDNGVALAAGQTYSSNGMVDTGPGPMTSIQRCTLFGKMHVAEINLLSESIVTGTVIADRSQDGIVRFSYLPMDSHTPPRYLCQPDTDLNSVQLTYHTEPKAHKRLLEDTESTLAPQFTSTRYNDPGYAQLNVNVSQSIATGAANGSEMGCFQSLNQPEYQAQLQALLDEYLPLGLITSLFYVT